MNHNPLENDIKMSGKNDKIQYKFDFDLHYQFAFTTRGFTFRYKSPSVCIPSPQNERGKRGVPSETWIQVVHGYRQLIP